MTETAPSDQTLTLTYAGDRRSSLGQEMGPTHLGEIFTVVDAVFDGTKTELRLVATGHINERRAEQSWWAFSRGTEPILRNAKAAHA